jgi:hypothetical protein
MILNFKAQLHQQQQQKLQQKQQTRLQTKAVIAITTTILI